MSSSRTARSGATVEARALTKRFEGRGRTSVPVFESLDLRVEAGTFNAILGPSGCGKSTLLRILAGLESPSGGSVSVSCEGHEARIGLMLQAYPSLPWLTVAGNLELAIRACPPRDDLRAGDALANYLLSRVGLLGWEDRYPHELSGGMLQRLALARTLAIGPDLVLLDEPLGALDASTKAEVFGLLRELQESESTTFIMVTHDVDQTRHVDRTVVLGPRGHGIVWDSAGTQTTPDPAELVKILSSRQVVLGAEDRAGLEPLLGNAGTDDAGFRLRLGLSSAERVESLQAGTLGAAFFSPGSIAQLGGRIRDLDPVVVHAFCHLPPRERTWTRLRRRSASAIAPLAGREWTLLLVSRHASGYRSGVLQSTVRSVADQIASAQAEGGLRGSSMQDPREIADEISRTFAKWNIDPIPIDLLALAEKTPAS